MKHDDPDWLEAMYNNRARVPDHAAHFERWARDSERVRATQACTLDIPYGPSAGQRLDVFPAKRPGAPGKRSAGAASSRASKPAWMRSRSVSNQARVST